MTFSIRESKHVFPKRSAVMLDGTEKPKIPSKFAKHTVRYNEVHCKITLKKIEKSILRCRKTINSLNNYFWEKQLCKEWSGHPIVRTARADDSNNNKTHLFPYYRLTNSKLFSSIYLIKHMVTALACTVELWIYLGDVLGGLLSL